VVKSKKEKSQKGGLIKMAKGTVVVKNAVKRTKGFLYFIDGVGNIRRVKMKGR